MKETPLYINQFIYDLPDHRIAKYPLADRSQSQLLVYRKGEIHTDHFFNLPHYFNHHDLLIWNNTKVIPARIIFHKETGARIEIFLLEPYQPKEYQKNFNTTDTCDWICIVGNLKKWKSGSLTIQLNQPTRTLSVSARILSINDNKVIIRFSWSPPEITFAEWVQHLGTLPIPPYLNRDPEPGDNQRYQTIYARFEGSVAAPTAGLHFTDKEIRQITDNGASIDTLILHIGAGTFIPVKTKDVYAHQMHQERVIVSKSLINNLLNNPGKKITSVGTTSMRSLESLYWLGNRWAKGDLPLKQTVDLNIPQWYPYEVNHPVTVKTSLQTILNQMNRMHLDSLSFSTSLMIIPGYSFRMADQLITNFHQPGSTLLLLVAAFIRESWKEVYQYALDHRFRFLSYGDSTLLIP